MNRRRVAWTLGATIALVVFPGGVGAVAAAQGATSRMGGSRISALRWMDIRDSAGVPLTDYVFATSNGGVLNPGETVLSVVLGLELVGYLVLVTTAVWVIGYAVSFQWLDLFASALHGVADTLTWHIATPTVLIAAASVGAFFVSWFVLRGQHAKATLQVLMMVGVGLFGPFVLAEPLADVLSPDGLLSHGRDLGVSVAAGLNGHPNPNPDQLVTTMQMNLADNFARKPLQVWNFGHVVDGSPRCRTAWTAGVRAGDQKQVLDGMQSCGDAAAYAEGRQPGMGQIGSGLVLLVCAALLLLFGAYLAFKIMRAAMDSIYHAFMAIFGFAAGGFIYGPTQTFLIRNLVDCVVASVRMMAFTIFLGVYVLFLGNLFEQARDQVMVVLVLGAIVELVAITQLRRLSANITTGASWITNRFAYTLKTGGALGYGLAGGGGSPQGMIGPPGLTHGAGLIGGMYAMNAFNQNPASAWLFMREKPLEPFSKLRKQAQVDLWRAQATPIGSGTIYGHEGLFTHNMRDRQSLVEAARAGVLGAAAAGRGGVNTARGAAASIEGAMTNAGASLSQLKAALRAAGHTDEDLVHNAVEARAFRMKHAAAEPLADKHLAGVIAAATYADMVRTPAGFAELESATIAYRERYERPVLGLRGSAGDAGTPVGHLHQYLANPTKATIADLQKMANGEAGPYSQAEAATMIRWIGTEHARRTGVAMERFLANPNDFDTVRAELSAATDTDRWAAGANRTPANTVS